MNSRHCQQRVISLQRSIRSAKLAVGEAAQRLADAQVIITITTITTITNKQPSLYIILHYITTITTTILYNNHPI